MAETCAGAPGVVPSVTELDAAEAGPLPTALVAKTVNVYALPLARPAAEVAAIPVAMHLGARCDRQGLAYHDPGEAC